VEAPRDLIRVQGLTEQPPGNFKGAMNNKTVSVHNGPVEVEDYPLDGIRDGLGKQPPPGTYPRSRRDMNIF
jgi:hypothetical protein